MQLNPIEKDTNEIALISLYILIEKKGKTIEWLDTSYNNKRLLLVTSQRGVYEVELYTFGYREKAFSLAVTITVPYYQCNKALFTKVNDELLIVSSNEFRIIQWSIFRNEIRHSILIERNPPLIITNAKLNYCKAIPNLACTLFVESNDKSLRIFNMDTKTCLFLLDQLDCWTIGNSGKWYITSVHSKEKNFLNFYLIQDYNKQPISSLLAKNDKQIIKIDTTKNNIYVIALNCEGEISVYTIWNMDFVSIINVGSGKIDNTTFTSFICLKDKDRDDIVISLNKEIITASIENNEIQVKNKKKSCIGNIKEISSIKYDHSIVLLNNNNVEIWL